MHIQERKYAIPEFDEQYYKSKYKNEDESDSRDDEDVEDISETCKGLYEESLKCNENILFNTTVYYDVAEEWAETTNYVACSFIEEVMQETNATSNASSGKSVVSSKSYTKTAPSNSYTMSSYSTYSNSKQSITGGGGGGGFYSAGAAVVIVGAAFVAVRRARNLKSIGKDLNDAFVYKAGETA